MPIFSYIAYPKQGQKKRLIRDLTALSCCEVTPAENEPVLILVTETPDEETERKLKEKINSISSLESLGMTFGHTDT